MSLPARPANLKAHAERIVRAIEEDRLEQMIRVPRGLKRAADQLCEHYHRKRNNQGLKNTLIEPEFSPRSEGTCSAITSVGRICRWRIASILHRRNSIIMFAVAGQPFLAKETELLLNRTQSEADPLPSYSSGYDGRVVSRVSSTGPPIVKW
jgi:hypothetical protein